MENEFLSQKNVENNLDLENSSICISNNSNFKNKKFTKRRAIFYIIFLFIFFILVYFLFFSAPVNFPINSNLNIQKGENLRDISYDLKEKNIIRSRVSFETFVILFGGEKHLAYGDYLFTEKIPVFEIALRLVNKERNLAPIRITIPEGYNVSDIAETFSTKLAAFDKDNFLLEAKKYEGYLFPDTYFFFTNDNEKDVLQYMRDTFDKRIKVLEKEILVSGKSEKEIIIMASIIEKEAKGDSDREIIAGILWNRIFKKMPLQVDADMWTYKNKGLPESPICNPGLKAITAALYPASSNYLYYLHDKDGNIHFAKTFTEHKINKARYLK